MIVHVMLPVIAALGRLRQENHNFKANLGYTVVGGRNTTKKSLSEVRKKIQTLVKKTTPYTRA
jgi:hypothetical protein